jgi:hypothetical protein
MKVIEIVEVTQTFSQRNPVLSGNMSLGQKLFDRIPGGSKLLSFLKIAGGLYLITDFLKRKDALNTQFNQFKKSNGAVPTTNMFSGSASVAEAQQKYHDQMEQLVGQVATEVALIWARNGFKNLLNGLATLIAWIPMVGWIPSIILRVFAWLITLSPTISILWLRNNNDFITSFIKKMLYGLAGWTSTELWNDVVALANDGLKQAGITKNDKIKDKLSIPTDPNSHLTGFIDGSKARANKNAIEVGDITATDKDGYLTLDPAFYVTVPVISTMALDINGGKGNPLDKIPKRPGVIYPTWDKTREKFEFPSGFTTQWEKFKGKT